MSLSTSVDTFLSRAIRCRRQLKDTWDAVSGTCYVFSQENIWPNQCNHFKKSLLKLSIPLQSFGELLETNRLPAEVISFHYSLIIPLHHIENVIDELMLLITAFSAVCRKPSRDAMIRRREIQCRLGELERGIEDVLQNVDRMLIQVLSQEKSTKPPTFVIEEIDTESEPLTIA